MDEREFKKFLKSYEAPPAALDERILGQARKSLYWENLLVLLKVFATHLLAGVATLAVCPQFGWSPFKAPDSLPHIFMSYGVWACGLFCGSFFMGAGALLSSILLGRREFLAYNRKLWTYSGVSSAVFMTALMFLGKEQASAHGTYLSVMFIGFWFIGAVALETLPNLVLARIYRSKGSL